MNCPGCQKQIDNDRAICPYCGIYVLIAKKNLKNCPFCKEMIQPDATICKFCKKSLGQDSREWYEKKRYVLPLIILEILIIGFITMVIKDFGKTIEDFEYKSNRLEIVAKLSEALDSINFIDSLVRFEYTDNKQINIDYVIFSYDKRSLQLSNFAILKKISKNVVKEGIRIRNVKIVATTPTGGMFTTINSIGDIVKIANGSLDFESWLGQTEAHEKDLF